MNSHNPTSFQYRARFASQGADARAADAHAGPVRSPAKMVSSRDLFDGAFEIGIDHHGSVYRLKITRQGKLILNK